MVLSLARTSTRSRSSRIIDSTPRWVSVGDSIIASMKGAGHRSRDATPNTSPAIVRTANPQFSRRPAPDSSIDDVHLGSRLVIASLYQPSRRGSYPSAPSEAA
jgi:hypothetical protein